MIDCSPEKLCGYLEAANFYKEIKQRNEFCQTGIYHDIIEITYVLSGRDLFDINGKIYCSATDDVRIIPPVNTLKVSPLFKTDIETGLISFQFCTQNPFCTEPVVINVSSRPYIKELFIKANNIWFRKESNYLVKTQSIFYKILGELLDLYETGDSASKNQAKLEPAIKYIHENYTLNPFIINKLPNICGIKHSYFNRLFQERFNMTPAKYITNLRMAYATDLLLLNTFSVSDISKKCGYENPCYFTKIFKEHYSCTPSQYRSNIQKRITNIKADNSAKY